MMLLQQIRQAIHLEMKAQRRARRSFWVSIENMEILSESPGRYIYRLELGQELRIVSDTEITIKVPGRDELFKVQVLLSMEQTLIVVSQEPLPQQMALVRFRFDPTFILESLDKHLQVTLQSPSTLLESIFARTIPSPNTITDTAIQERLTSNAYKLNTSQLKAVTRMQADDVHLLWGPPGTGKTYTVGTSIAEHIRAGRTCLLLSTSNAAVDEMVKATARALGPSLLLDNVFRAGVSGDKDVNRHTAVGYYRRQNKVAAQRADQAQTRLSEITSNPKTYLGSQASTTPLYREIQTHKDTIKAFVQAARIFGDEQLSKAQCVASTLASLVINPTIYNRRFDVVYIDEASMVSLPFAFAGAAQATQQVIFAGDFQQLPPICHSEDERAIAWFGKNIFDHLEVTQTTRNKDIPAFVSMLRQQYRMTQTIANIVSKLSYGGRLECGDGIDIGNRPIFIDVATFCGTSHFSIEEQSYYHPYSALLLQNLRDYFSQWLGPINLILTPFRSQQSLMQSLAKDLTSPNHTFTASTIHKSQGSQEDTVIVDLTAHSAVNPQQFFTGEETEKLINVALSRAQNRLLIIGNLEMIRQLAHLGGYWERFWNVINTACTHIKAGNIVAGSRMFRDIAEGIRTLGINKDDVQLPSVYVEDIDTPCPSTVQELFVAARSSTKLVVLHKRNTSASRVRGITYRRDKSSVVPSFGVSRGILGLPLPRADYGRRWAFAELPETTKKLNFLACGHLLDGPFEVQDTIRTLCPRCNHALTLSQSYGTYRFTCERMYECNYSRQLTLKDAQILIETNNIRCPECKAKPQPRISHAHKNVFVGCSNYPTCREIIDLTLYV